MKRIIVDSVCSSCYNQDMNEEARFQVVEVPGGYAVKDTRDGSIWTKTYVRMGNAVNAAVRLQEAHGSRKYF